MSKPDLNAITKRFLLQETPLPVGIYTYVQALSETLKQFKAKTQTENRIIQIAQQQLKEIRKHARKLEEKVHTLQEQIKLLEENKDK